MSVSTERESNAAALTAANDRTFSFLPGDETIRAEILGFDGLKNQAQELAGSARVGRVYSSAAPPFLDNGRELAHANQRIVDATMHEKTIATDAERRLDNDHGIEDTLREVRQDLPQSYDAQSRETALCAVQPQRRKLNARSLFGDPNCRRASLPDAHPICAPTGHP